MDAELVVGTFVELADALPGGAGVTGFTRLVVDRVTELADADSAVLLLAANDRARPALAASSSPRARELARLQIELDEGPCLQALRDGVVARHSAGTRWPRFAREIGTAEPLSLDAIPVRREGVTGALGIVRAAPTGLDEPTMGMATAIADLAAISIARHGRLHTGQRHAKRLRSTLDVLIVVEQAKGILAERTGTDVETAHRLMQDYAHVQNESLDGIAHRVIADAGKST
ncbi:GAF and ANTAR domain-containing protein [Amycolatopsis minnesotensis]|uniref:GAF and ANTAR domain-containing protein n=1 Tax=Amycolatopsis minnesotensis TaxID=337894 RepID=A0ABP5BBG3_9PSEU